MIDSYSSLPTSPEISHYITELLKLNIMQIHVDGFFSATFWYDQTLRVIIQKEFTHENTQQEMRGGEEGS